MIRKCTYISNYLRSVLCEFQVKPLASRERAEKWAKLASKESSCLTLEGWEICLHTFGRWRHGCFLSSLLFVSSWN